MSKINRFAIPAFALAAILSIGSVVGLAQTNAPVRPDRQGRRTRRAGLWPHDGRLERRDDGLRRHGPGHDVPGRQGPG